MLENKIDVDTETSGRSSRVLTFEFEFDHSFQRASTYHLHVDGPNHLCRVFRSEYKHTLKVSGVSIRALRNDAESVTT